MTIRALLAAFMLVASTASPADDLADVQRLAKAGQLETALQRTREVPSPRPASIRFAEGVILMDLRRDDEARAVFEAVAQEAPELPEPYNNLALLHARAGRLDAARGALEVALRNDPTNALARRNLGEVYLQLALQSWEAVAAAQPDDRELRRRLALARELGLRSR